MKAKLLNGQSVEVIKGCVCFALFASVDLRSVGGYDVINSTAVQNKIRRVNLCCDKDSKIRIELKSQLGVAQ